MLENFAQFVRFQPDDVDVRQAEQDRVNPETFSFT